MSLNVLPSTGTSGPLCPPGSYQAVCCEVLQLGYSTKAFTDRQTGEKKERSVNEVQYVFQVSAVDAESGKRYEVRSKPLNLLFSEQPMSDLRKFFISWRGHDLTDAEKLPPGVDVDLTGRNALITVVHAESNSKTYANIGSIMPLMENMPPIVALNYESHQAQVTKWRSEQATKAASGGVVAHTGPAAAPPVNAVDPQVGF